MSDFHKDYILDENNKPCAVIIPIAEFEYIEKILEKHSLAKMIKDTRKNSDMWLEECFKLMDNARGNSKGKKWTRKELYDV